MDFRKLGDLDLAGFAANVVAVLGGPDLPAVDAVVKTSLTTEFGTLPATLETETLAATVAEDDRKSAVSARRATRRQVVALLKKVRDTLMASEAPEKEWAKAGFDYPDLVLTRYIAQDPANLSAFGYSNGVNTLRFDGNNKPGRVVYEIWRRHGDTVDWYLHMTTRRQRLIDTPVSPGQYYMYKVRAVGARSVSNFSNVAVVYGAV
ncbi:MAG: hypothetical protein IPK98_00640 [Chloracidobacterium sp.]|nr:hypothetical protein [Chloracidobacterium sp.]